MSKHCTIAHRDGERYIHARGNEQFELPLADYFKPLTALPQKTEREQENTSRSGEPLHIDLPNLWDIDKQDSERWVEESVGKHAEHSEHHPHHPHHPHHSHLPEPHELLHDLGAAVVDGVEQAYRGMDSNAATHWVKHNLCKDDPVKVGVIGSVVALGMVAAVAPSSAIVGAASSAAIFGGLTITIDSIVNPVSK